MKYEYAFRLSLIKRMIVEGDDTKPEREIRTFQMESNLSEPDAIEAFHSLYETVGREVASMEFVAKGPSHGE